MRKDAHAALAAAFVAHFGEADSVAANRDFLVVLEQIFGHAARGFIVTGLGGGELAFDGGFLGFDRTALRGGCGFGFGQRANGGGDQALELFAGHHAFKQAVFGARHFGFRVLDFVLEGFESFVGLNLETLILVFLRAFFPLLYVQLEPLAIFLAAEQGFLGCGQIVARRLQARVNFGESAREFGQPRPQLVQAMVHSLQLRQMFQCRIHPLGILTHAFAAPSRWGKWQYCRL